MGVKISVATLAVLTWLSITSARSNDTRPQRLNTGYLNDNIAQPQKYREVIMYLTPSQIRTLQQTQEQHGLILPSPTSAPESLNEREIYFYPNKNQQNQESNDQAQYPYASMKEGLSSYDGDVKNIYAELYKQKDNPTDIPVAESAYEYKDENSYVYNRFRTVFSTKQDEKYVAPEQGNSVDQSRTETKNTQQKEYNNPQTQTSTISPELLKQLLQTQQQESIYKNIQNAYNFQESDFSKQSDETNNKQYNGFRQSVSDLNTLPSFEQSYYDQLRNNYQNERPSFFPISKVQVSLPAKPDLPIGQRETLRIPLNFDHDTQLLFKNKYQLVPYEIEPKDRIEHKLLLEELLNQRIPDNVKTSMFHGIQPQTQNKLQNAPNFNEPTLSSENQKFLEKIRLINLESQAKAEEISNLPPFLIRKEVKITKHNPKQWFNSQPVSTPVQRPASTVPEINVPHSQLVPQDNIKPLELSTSLVRPENVVLDKQVVGDLGNNFSTTSKQNPAESVNSFHKDIPVTESNTPANKEVVKKEKKLTIIKHVWTD